MMELTLVIVLIIISVILMVIFRRRINKDLNFWSSLFTIIAVLFAVGTYLYDRHSTQEININERKLLVQDLLQEIKDTEQILTYLENKMNDFYSNNEIPSTRLTTIAFEESIHKIDFGNYKLRGDLRQCYYQMMHLNLLFENWEEFYVQSFNGLINKTLRVETAKERANIMIDKIGKIRFFVNELKLDLIEYEKNNYKD